MGDKGRKQWLVVKGVLNRMLQNQLAFENSKASLVAFRLSRILSYN